METNEEIKETFTRKSPHKLTPAKAEGSKSESLLPVKVEEPKLENLTLLKLVEPKPEINTHAIQDGRSGNEPLHG